jgi:heme O synthase-like polyprenyltransferase
MLKREDLSGCATAMQSLLFTLGLTAITLTPFFAGLNNSAFLVGACVLDAAMLFCAARFLLLRNRPSARGPVLCVDSFTFRSSSD